MACAGIALVNQGRQSDKSRSWCHAARRCAPSLRGVTYRPCASQHERPRRASGTGSTSTRVLRRRCLRRRNRQAMDGGLSPIADEVVGDDAPACRSAASSADAIVAVASGSPSREDWRRSRADPAAMQTGRVDAQGAGQCRPRRAPSPGMPGSSTIGLPAVCPDPVRRIRPITPPGDADFRQ